MSDSTPAAKVRARFTCQSVTPLSDADPTAGVAVRLSAVYGDGTDNAAWSAATPSGQLDMSITAPGAAGAFVAGVDYWLDLTPVAATTPAEDPFLEVSSTARYVVGPDDDASHFRFPTVSADPGNALSTGSDGLPYLSRSLVFGEGAPHADLGTIEGVTVVATEAEVDQPGGPAQAWKGAAQAAST